MPELIDSGNYVSSPLSTDDIVLLRGGVLKRITHANMVPSLTGGGLAPTHVYYLSRVLGTRGDADLSFGSTTFGTDRTAQIQGVLNAATQANPILIYWDGRYSVTGLRIKSYTTIIALPDCGAILRNNSDDFLIRNNGWVASNNAIVDYDITIIGGIWNGNGYQGITPMQVHSNATHGMLTGFNFSGVQNLVMKDLEIRNTRCYAMLTMTMENVFLDNVTIDQGANPQINQDGVDWIGKLTNLHVTNCKSRCGDDRWAHGSNAAGGSIPSEDHTPYTGVNGDQDGIYYSNLYFWGPGKGFRFNSSANPISNIYINNVSGTAKGLWFVAEHFGNLNGYTFTEGPGNIYNLNVENVRVDVNGSWGYDAEIFGDITIGINCDRVSFKNIFKKDFSQGRPTICIHNAYGVRPVIIKDAVFDNISTYETTAINNLPIFRLRAVFTFEINNLRLLNFKCIRELAANGTYLLHIEDGATVQNLEMSGVSAHNINSVVINEGVLNDVQAVKIRHTGSVIGPAFYTDSTVNELILSNFKGSTITSGTFTTTSGDAFP